VKLYDNAAIHGLWRSVCRTFVSPLVVNCADTLEVD
jgi:hypothetical protein